MGYELFIGLRYLKAKRKQRFISIITFISIAGVAVGVMALIVVLSVMTGFDQELKEKILGTNAHIVVMKYGGDFKEYYEIRKKIEKDPEVLGVTPFTFNQVMLVSKSAVTGVVLRGVDFKSIGKVTTLLKCIKKGNPKDIDKGKVPGILIGQELAYILHVTIGDIIHVVSPMGRLGPMGMTPKAKSFKVTGIFETGMYEYDTSLAYISLKAAQKFFEIGDSVSGLEIKIKDAYNARKVAADIKERIGSQFFAKDWMQMNKNLFSALKLEKKAMFIILTLIILVAAFNILSTLIMVVMEKTKDIAILRSIGATSRSIMKIFIIEGLIIGVIGTLFGLISGLLVAFNLNKITSFIEDLFHFKILSSDVYYISKLPSQVMFSDVLMIVIFGIAITFLATIYPAWRASRLNPAEAIRYE